jgi:hypothetical protein
METVHKITIELSLTRRKALVLLALFFLCWRPGSLGSETLTMTTYYPAPYGGYARLLTTNQTLLARDAGNVGIGTNAPTAKLDVAGGEIRIDSGQTIRGRGRLHIMGTELLYLLNTSGGVIGREWGGNGNLQVQGNITLVNTASNITNFCSVRPVSWGCGTWGRPMALYPANTGAVVRYALNRSGSDLHNSGNWSMFNANPGGWGGNMLCCKAF